MNSGLVAASSRAVVRRRAPGGTRLLIRKDHKPRPQPVRCGANSARSRVKAHAIVQQVRSFVATRTFVLAQCRNPVSGWVAKSEAAVLAATPTGPPLPVVAQLASAGDNRDVRVRNYVSGADGGAGVVPQRLEFHVRHRLDQNRRDQVANPVNNRQPEPYETPVGTGAVRRPTPNAAPSGSAQATGQAL